MKEQNLYRLSFASKEQWKQIESELIGEGETPLHKFAAVEVRHVPIPATYDENGKVLTEATAHTDWAVDVVSDDLLPLNDYIVRNKSGQWYNEITGGTFNIVQATPTIDWLKAEIQDWLTSNDISWTTSMTKDELLNLI